MKTRAEQPTGGIPRDFSNALAGAGLADFFANCTGPHQREYLKWISEARRPETRLNRIRQAVKMVAAKCAEEKVRAKKKAGH